MALRPEDISAFEVLANDPEDRKILVERLKRHPDNPAVKNHPALKSREEVETYLAPLHEKIKGLEEQVHKQQQSDTWLRQRNSLRGGPFKFDDDKIKRLEERMKDPDAPVFPEIDSHGRTAYQNAATYFQQLDTPLAPSSVPMLDMGGMPVGGGDAEPWRKDLESTDKNVNPLMMSRKQRKLKARRAWTEASKDYMEKLSGNTGRF
jgi:hypothetical protein